MDQETKNIDLCGFSLQVPNSLIFQSKMVLPLKLNQIVNIPCAIPASPIPKYFFKIVDSSSPVKLKQKTMAVFIIPIGQESSWTFSTESGLQELLLQIDTSRVVYVILNHGFVFKQLLDIQEELKQVVLALMPPVCNTSKILFMTNGDIGERSLVYSDSRVIVEDVKEGDYFLRQMIFLSNVNQVQSEVRLDLNKNDEANEVEEGSILHGPFLQNYQVLTFEYQRAMLVALGFYPEVSLNKHIKILVLGAGACILPAFIVKHFENSEVTAVDIDPQVVELGTMFFGVKQHPRLTINIQNALNISSSYAAEQFDYIFLDICIGNINIPTPPPEFTSPDYQIQLHSLLTPQGIVITNIIGSEFQCEKIINEAREVFQNLYKCRCKEDTNQILFCLKNQEIIDWKLVVKGLEVIENSKKWDRTMALVEYAERVKFIENPKSAQSILQGKKKNNRKKRKNKS